MGSRVLFIAPLADTEREFLGGGELVDEVAKISFVVCIKL